VTLREAAQTSRAMIGHGDGRITLQDTTTIAQAALRETAPSSRNSLTRPSAASPIRASVHLWSTTHPGEQVFGVMTAHPAWPQSQYWRNPGEIVTTNAGRPGRALRIVDMKNGAAVGAVRRTGKRTETTPTCSKRRSAQKKNRKMSDDKQSAEDLAILEQLNLDYVHSDQFNDVKRFSEFLAEDFLVQTPGVTRNRDEFLDYIAKPRPFKDLAVHDVNIRILSDVALIHARATYTMLSDGVNQEALYTDTYQKRDGTWVCVAACAIAPGA
jgi:hypothetical protein